MEDQIQTSSLLDIDAEQQCHCSEIESPDGLPKIDKRNLNVKKPHKEVRTGCLAQMTISRQSDGRYRVIHFEANHNHEVVGPEYVHALPSHRKLTVSQAIEADLVDRSSIQRKLTFKLMGKEDGIQENAMSGRKPRTILTVQDMAIAKAIGKKNFPVMGIYTGQIWSSGKCMASRPIQRKEKWAMVYGRRMFCGDLKSTWLSDGFNSCLRKYLKSDLDILQFFNHFERMVVDLRDKELQSNIVSQRAPILETSAVVLKHAWDIYSPEVFEVFQKEFEDSCDLVIDQCNENGPLSEYKLSSFGKLCQHTVAFNSSDETVECSCMKFEYAGILCSHALKVLDVRSIKVVPEKYILKRWTKDARVENIENFDECITKEDPKLLMLSRYKDLTQKAIRLSTWAADSEEGYLFLNRIFKDSMVDLTGRFHKVDGSLWRPAIGPKSWIAVEMGMIGLSSRLMGIAHLAYIYGFPLGQYLVQGMRA
ncbi:Protein FAR1-related sequence 9 [Vitis vinifera]|uniref:Protein FAR1-RELATED SEQUENCE n=1 Tax=Vitis vinifera TaxID=29760 RepID=A0A438JF49_VITVI|nr:Protein FAR1-related sequence 9 [Vitis vinifera]